MKYDMLRYWTELREAKKADTEAKPFTPMPGVQPLNTELNPAREGEKVEGVKWTTELNSINESAQRKLHEIIEFHAKLTEDERVIKDAKPNSINFFYDWAGRIFGKNVIHPMYIEMRDSIKKVIYKITIAKQEPKGDVEEIDYEGMINALYEMKEELKDTLDILKKTYTKTKPARQSPKTIDVKIEPMGEAFDGLISKVIQYVKLKINKFHADKQKLDRMLGSVRENVENPPKTVLKKANDEVPLEGEDDAERELDAYDKMPGWRQKNFRLSAPDPKKDIKKTSGK